MCEVLEISTSTYYKYRNTIDPDYSDYIVIKQVFDDNFKSYGYRRITDELQDDYGMIINHKRVARIMRKFGIVAKYIENLVPSYSKKRTEEEARDDLIQRNFEQRGWVTDISTLQLVRNGVKAYLSVILDLETRDWVSYKIAYTQENKLVMDTLNEAISKRKDLNGLVLHSDRGSQYLSTEYKIICESNGILISHSRVHNPKDNAVIESFFGIMKKETLYNNSITTLDEYIQLVRNWMIFYNTKRRRNKK
jgi:transposase InsO family protein